MPSRSAGAEPSSCSGATSTGHTPGIAPPLQSEMKVGQESRFARAKDWTCHLTCHWRVNCKLPVPASKWNRQPLPSQSHGTVPTAPLMHPPPTEPEDVRGDDLGLAGSSATSCTTEANSQAQSKSTNGKCPLPTQEWQDTAPSPGVMLLLCSGICHWSQTGEQKSLHTATKYSTLPC